MHATYALHVKSDAASSAPVEPAETSAVGLARADGLGGLDDRGVLLGARREGGVLVVGDLLAAEELHRDAGHARALRDGVGAGVGPVEINRYRGYLGGSSRLAL